jgi:hypothetical protein
MRVMFAVLVLSADGLSDDTYMRTDCTRDIYVYVFTRVIYVYICTYVCADCNRIL